MWTREGVGAAGCGAFRQLLLRPAAVLRWFTANIGIHHVHHLNSRIPYYRLQQVLSDHPELKAVGRLTFAKACAACGWRLWSESRKKLIGFDDLRDEG